ncbi:MAG: nicotinate-nucleotide adenylyltransferase [Pseudanabaenaceae cyanobacterium bins.68]|nr:nicotinate-nucleotide adenylyltransferase [Pseudanabaenaceae cyanobacterium bins.68]
MRIALFGTSGDPPTIGHQKILQWLCAHYHLVVVWVSNNPFKTHHATLEQRLEMMALITDSIAPKPRNLEIHPEISHPHTLKTIELARQIWTQDTFDLVIGADLVGQIPTWYRAPDLLSQVNLLVVPRQGYEILATDLERLHSFGTKVAIADLAVPISSSTEFRQKGAESHLIPALLEYIHRNCIYPWLNPPS